MTTPLWKRIIARILEALLAIIFSSTNTCAARM